MRSEEQEGKDTEAHLAITPCVVVVVVEWLNYSKRIINDKRADLSEFFSLIVVCKMCVFVSRPMKIVTFGEEKR